MKTILKKSAAFVIGLFAIILLLEIALRILGYMGEREAAVDIEILDKNKNVYTVMCVGDSFTRGVGAPTGQDYPSRLEPLLNVGGEKTFKVINVGVAGKNSSQILSSLPSEIEAAQPDIVVLLTGGANHWNYYGYAAARESGGLALSDFLYGLRVYKLTTLLSRNVKDKLTAEETKNTNEHLEQSKYENLMKKFNAAVKQNPNDAQAYYEVGDFYMYEQNVEKAITWFQKGIEADSKAADNYLSLVLAHHALGRHDEEVKWLDRAVQDCGDTGKDKIYSYLVTFHLEAGEVEKSILYAKEGLRINPHCRDIFDILQYALNYENLFSQTKGSPPILLPNISENHIEEIAKLLESFPPIESLVYLDIPERLYEAPVQIKDKLRKDGELVLSWIEADLEKIIGLCKAKGIKLIMQNYPLRGHHESHMSRAYKNAGVLLEKTAKKYAIPFVNNKKKFNMLGENKENYLEPLGLADHCNAKGYAYMAQNIFEVIMSLEQEATDEYKTIEDCDKAIELDPQNIAAYNKRGALKARESNFSEAIADFNKAIELDSQNVDAYGNRGHVNVNVNKFSEALDDFGKVIELDPKNIKAYNRRGAVKAQLSDYVGAIADLNKALELDPKNMEAHGNLGRVKMGKGDYEEAVIHFNKALELDPKNIDAYNNRGYLKSMLEDYKGAIADYDKLLVLDKDHPYAYSNRGYAKYKLKDFKDALKDINKSLELFKTNSYAYKNRALVYIALNNIQEACKDLQDALSYGYSKDYGDEARALLNKYCK